MKTTDQKMTDMVLAMDARIKELESKLQATAAPEPMTYQQAKKAIRLFEAEYMGQPQKALWEWAVNQALRNAGGGE